jgi:hypothetical protein
MIKRLAVRNLPAARGGPKEINNVALKVYEI